MKLRGSRERRICILLVILIVILPVWNGLMAQTTNYTIEEITGDCTLEGDYTTDHKIFKVKDNTTCTITLNGATIEYYSSSSMSDDFNRPLTIGTGANVTLILQAGTTNKIYNSKYAGIFIGENATLTIKSSDGNNTGKLDVTGGTLSFMDYGIIYSASGIYCYNNSTLTIESGNIYATTKDGAGIGGNYKSNKTTINIKGGIIKAIGGSYGAGIGGSNHFDLNVSNSSIINISGGEITAIGGSNAAGIGGGFYDGFGTVKISGGKVYAEGSNGGAGIGAGFNSGKTYELSVDNIIITGGEVTAIGSVSGDSWGAPIGGYKSTKVKNYVCTVDIKLQDEANSDYYFHGPVTYDNGIVKTSAYNYEAHGTLPIDFTVSEEDILNILNGKPLTVTEEEGHRLTNNGHIYVDETVSENLKGTVYGTGKINQYYKVTYKGNADGVTNIPIDDNNYRFKSDVTINKETIPIHTGYVFKGWAFEEDKTEAIITSSFIIRQDMNLYAIWAKDFTITTPSELTGEYGASINEYDLATLFKGDDDVTLKSVICTSDNLPKGLAIENNKIVGTFKEATEEEGKKVTFEFEANNGVKHSTDLTIKISPAELTIKPDADQILYKDEEIKYTYEGVFNDEKPEFTGKLIVENGKIAIGSLALVGELAKNYIIKSIIDVNFINHLDINVKDIEAKLSEADGKNGCYKEKVTFTAPEGFKIKKVKNEGLRDETGYTSSFEFTDEGSWKITYSLLRDNTTDEYEHTADIIIDNTAPEINTVPLIDYQKATFTIMDQASGIASYSYKLDDGKEKIFNEPEHPAEVHFSIDGTVGSHKIVIAATDYAGNASTSVEITFELKSRPYTPPVIAYYTITLPEVEGVVTTPAAGDYTVMEGNSFSFSLKLADDYDQSVPVVTAEGKRIEPHVSDGKYVIRSIYDDLDISIEGIVRNSPTANEAVVSEMLIRPVGSTLFITVPQAVRVRITNMGGRIVRMLDLAAGMTRVSGLEAGVYIVSIEDRKGVKIMIR